jgi:hypothetical protein
MVDRKVYLFVYSDSLGTRDEIKECLTNMPEVLTWRRDLPHAFYLISTASAQALADAIRARLGKSGRFLVTEISSNRQGWLTPASWHLIRHKEHRPK